MVTRPPASVSSFALAALPLLAGQVADRAGNHGHLVAAFCQVAGQLVVAGAARLVKRSESLVNEQDVHRLDRQNPLAGDGERCRGFDSDCKGQRRDFDAVG